MVGKTTPLSVSGSKTQPLVQKDQHRGDTMRLSRRNNVRNSLEGTRSVLLAEASVQNQEEKHEMMGMKSDEQGRRRKGGEKERRSEKSRRLREIVYMRERGREKE